MKSYISDSLCWHFASLQLRSHSYGYAPSVVPRIVPAQVARNIRFHMASYLMHGGGQWVLDVDIQKYFDTIDHSQLRLFLARRVSDGVVRKLIVSS